ncbi:oxygenase MpaB family protein [Pseudonocardia sp. EC080610-09]|uniref:oxygenase MpaB family protein n=1 Tax=Pseudonocardia sp. EC080610-09 TaxID=1688404 RepID=UPI0007614180|nr:oxygenase MpaB family protein [Pseudonocardia sp. EC080610-09]
MTAPNTRPVGGRVVDPATRDHQEDQVDLLLQSVQVGDPLADAVVAEFDELGDDAKDALRHGLVAGRASVPDAPPEVDALLADAETVPDWVDTELLAQGDKVSLAVPDPWNRVAFSAGSLTHTYSSPTIARLLVGTGRLTSTAPRRIAETGLWNAAVVLPGGLLTGAPGYVQTVQVRLLHARVRASALAHGWDSARWGAPINQADIARTWLDFTLVPVSLLEIVGYRLTEVEQRRLYSYWYRVAHLLGLDERFFVGVESHQQADTLCNLFDSTLAPPDENSRALVAALYGAAATGLAATPQSPMDEQAWRELLHAVARRHHGDEAADALAIPPSPLTPLLPLIALAESRTRAHQLRFPEVLRQAEQAGIDRFRAFTTLLTDHTAYQTHMEGTR